MSQVQLLSWRAGHGLGMYTQKDAYGVIALRGSGVKRLVNGLPVEKWPDNSRTAKQLETLFRKFRDQLAVLNARRDDPDCAVYNTLWWTLQGDLRHEQTEKYPKGVLSDSN